MPFDSGKSVMLDTKREVKSARREEEEESRWAQAHPASNRDGLKVHRQGF